MPLSIVFILLFLAIVFSLLHSKNKSSYTHRVSQTCLLLSFTVLLLSSTPFFANQLVKSIEKQDDVFYQQNIPLDYIVILGCGHTTNEALPEISQLQLCSFQRLIEAIRIYQLHPEATLITSGDGGSDIEANAIKVKRAAISLGIPEDKIIAKPTPKDTQEEAAIMSSLLLNKQFALVTNASHIPRATQYFIAQGLKPIPAPTGFSVNDEPTNFISNLPSASTLKQTNKLWHEVLGQLVQWINE